MMLGSAEEMEQAMENISAKAELDPAAIFAMAFMGVLIDVDDPKVPEFFKLLLSPIPDAHLKELATGCAWASNFIQTLLFERETDAS